MTKLSELLEAEVVDEAGERRGRVHDVRVRRLERRSPDGHALRVIGLVIGGRGLRERLGIDTAKTAKPIADRDFIPWEQVRRVDDGKVVVVSTTSS